MIILGIGDSHEAHACILKGGKLVAAISEERLSRLKADMGYPKRSIDAVINISGISPEEIDVVAFAGARGSAFHRLYKPNAYFKVQHWIRQCKEYWNPLLLQGQELTPSDDFNLFFEEFREKIEVDPYFPFIERIKGKSQSEYTAIFNDLRKEVLHKHLGIAENKIRFYRHEDCHKIYGFFSSPKRPSKALVLTLEGGGDDSSATVSTVDQNDITEHWKSNAVMIGRLYRYVTLILGMLPGQHEYKVMGLAPYGTEYHGKKSLEFFRKIDEVSGFEILNKGQVRDMYFSVREALEGERFDGVAWGLQAYLEEILVRWVENCVEEFKISDVILSGGVAQNIKACKSVMESNVVDSMWSGPITGDGSLGIGAAWLAHKEDFNDCPIEGFGSVYLGTEYDATQTLEALERNELKNKYELVQKPSTEKIAEWLAAGKIIARYSGRMEFGQRALGNRSIIADPRNFSSVEHINKKIKNRDFWMPFTPSMLDEEAERLLVNPKKIFSPYMTMAFDLEPAFSNSIPAAIHPADKTARPQMVRKQENPGYYKIIEAFKEKTNLGVVLNTSFNLHGDAIVESPQDAVDTFVNSGLDVLLFDDVAILR